MFAKVVRALRELGQRSTPSVIAEEMGCEVPDIQMANLAEQGRIFTCYLPDGTLIKEHPSFPLRIDCCQFGLLEWEN